MTNKEQMNPLVSVIMPTYNTGEFLSEAIDSVLTQELTNLELIIINDGSTDNTESIINKYNDPRIRVINKQNQGLSAARNDAIDIAQGQYLSFLDADDRWKPAKLLEEQKIFDSEPSVGLIFSNFVRFNHTGIYPETQFDFYQGINDIPYRQSQSGIGQVVTVPAFESFIRLYDFPAWTQVITVKRDVFGNLRFRDVKRDEKGRLALLEDLSLIPIIFSMTDIAYIREPMAEVRRHDNNSTKDLSYIKVAILNSLLCLEDGSLSKDNRKALNNRIARQYMSVGVYYAKEKFVIKALASYFKGLFRGRILAFFKRVILLPVDYFGNQ
ncbi:MAG: glycosyltransferase [Candidatus Thiodiazotropha taylori]|nr:glycosyltransferase [Candidatus Thiodiazotropha taylori]